jgi:hypothetical protein
MHDSAVDGCLVSVGEAIVATSACLSQYGCMTRARVFVC